MPVPYRLAESVNAEVNRSVTYKTDAQQYTIPDFWKPDGKFGDCEDYALAKRGHILAAGFSANDMGLCVCVTETGEGHCVLAVNTDRGWFILDNRTAWPVVPSSLPYKWELMLCNGEWRQLAGW
jgi:predicted transglutaminase-like cysteine proteinase